jgi:predicted transcriptional regulator
VPRLGDLERAVMEVLWAAGAPMPARAVGDALGDRTLAVTTILTVLSRLERKGVVVRTRDGRAHSYAAASTREEHVAELMHEALGTAGDRDAALARFVRAASHDEAEILRQALRRYGR